jgi:outer membrane protein assembly factor BamB
MMIEKLFSTVLVIAFAALTPALSQQELFELNARDGAAGDAFGDCVAINGNTAIVGSMWDDTCMDCAPPRSGSVHFFDVQTGQEIRKVAAADIGAGLGFGASVAIRGHLALVGASGEDAAQPRAGAAYLIDVNTGLVLHRLTASDALENDGFGQSVAIDGTLGIIGGGSNSYDYEVGSVYVFDLTTAQELRRIEPADGFVGDGFGHQVALSGTFAVISASDSRRSYLFDVSTGAELFSLLPADGASLGDGVATDGNLVIVGSRLTDDVRPTYSGTDSGSAYVFDASTGTELFKLTACDAGFGDQFGRSVAIEGDLALVGVFNPISSSYSVPNSGVYAFDLTSGQEIAKLISSTGIENDHFASSIAIDGDRAIVGAWLGGGVVSESGVAYVFDVDIQTPEYCDNTPPVQGLPENSKLLTGDGALEDEAGTAVAVHGHLALVGTPMHDDGCVWDPLCASGSAYLFDLSTGQELLEFVASDADAYVLGGARLGFSVALDAERALLGAVGSHSAYLFDVTSGQELFKLEGVSADKTRYGSAVALDGNLAAIGAEYDSDAGMLAGAVHVVDVTTGQELLKLAVPGSPTLGRLGHSVDIGEGRIVAGARGGAGTVYVFVAATGQQLFELTPSGGKTGDEFGHSVAIAGDLLLIGAIYGDGPVADCGSVYVFDLQAGQELYALHASDASPGDLFGCSIAASAGRALIGAWGDDLGAMQSGSAYYFDLMTGQEVAKLNASDVAADDRFGFGVGLDRGRAVVGSPRDDNPLKAGGSAYFFDLREGLGTSYCTSSANSTGAASSVGAFGSASLGLENLELHASAAPVGQPGLFFVGPLAVNIPFGEGTRCVGGGLVRLLKATYETNGEFVTQVDFERYGSALAGMSTAHFQCWYRDPAGGGTGFNLSDGVMISFVP